MRAEDSSPYRSKGRGVILPSAMRRTRELAVISACLIAASAAGCASGKPARPMDEQRWPGAAVIDPDADWPFWPWSMRVHPLTQYREDRVTGRLIIETRVEFVDAWGDTCKALGQLDIELYDGDSPSSDAIIRWDDDPDLDLNDLDVNHQRYDIVTRTYLFRLEIEKGQELPTVGVLRAYFTSADGRRLQAQEELAR